MFDFIHEGLLFRLFAQSTFIVPLFIEVEDLVIPVQSVTRIPTVSAMRCSRRKANARICQTPEDGVFEGLMPCAHLYGIFPLFQLSKEDGRSLTDLVLWFTDPFIQVVFGSERSSSITSLGVYYRIKK